MHHVITKHIAVEFNTTLLKTEFTKQFINKIQEKHDLQNKKVVQLYGYNTKNNTIICRLVVVRFRGAR